MGLLGLNANEVPRDPVTELCSEEKQSFCHFGPLNAHGCMSLAECSSLRLHAHRVSRRSTAPSVPVPQNIVYIFGLSKGGVIPPVDVSVATGCGTLSPTVIPFVQV